MRYYRSASQLPHLPPDVAKQIEEISKRYVFRANSYYLDLIDWNDPADPIRQLVIPRMEELNDWGALDASNEASNYVVKGVQHKYRDTALVLVNSVCGAYCRYCFRKRLFMNDNDETIHELGEAYEYIGAHPEITDVLLTGGDPLIMSTGKLRPILERFAAMPHVRTIRIGSKMPAFNPYRILDDRELQALLREVTDGPRAVYVMAHFDHPRELTAEAREGIQTLMDCGVRVVNQCPVIRGINDDADVLAELFGEMSLLGAPQYYLFQCRPTAGNQAYDLPITRGYELFQAAQRKVSGLSRRARFSMSHASGKIEVIGLDERHLYLRYHRARNPQDEGRVMICRRDDSAHWFDDLVEVGRA
ncbi:MAG: KamA family radical SAM protein [Candidatus Eisenbacteria bacterium]